MNGKALGTFELYDAQCIQFVKKFRSADRFVKAFRAQYEFIIAYHGTNINEADATAIRQEGVKCSNLALMKSRAEDRFILDTDTLFQQEQIRQLITAQFEDEELITEGLLYFTLEKEPLQGLAYQYLFFGPESLLPVADHLRRSLGQNFRKRMMEYGQSTIIKAKITVSKITDNWLKPSLAIGMTAQSNAVYYYMKICRPCTLSNWKKSPDHPISVVSCPCK